MSIKKIIRFGRRKNDWELIDKTIIPSIEETRAKIAREEGQYYNGDSHVTLFGMTATFRPPDESLQGMMVLTFKCRNTNKIKIVTHWRNKTKVSK